MSRTMKSEPCASRFPFLNGMQLRPQRFPSDSLTNCSRSTVDRARQRYLVDGMQFLVKSQAAAIKKANESRNLDEQEEIPDLPDFDLETMDFESDHEEDEDEE